MRFGVGVFAVAVLSAVAACTGISRPGPNGPTAGRSLALVGGTIYTAPYAVPIANAVLVIEGERITAVGTYSQIRVPEHAVIVDVSGKTVLPAFWNTHVHLMEPKWLGVGAMDSDRLGALLREMFTRFGFVNVFDIGSYSAVTLALRRRIQSGDVPGPDIRTTLLPFVPPNGTPRYVAPLKLPELNGPRAASDSVGARISRGADAIKIFTVPITENEPFPVMPPEVVRAVTDEAHRAGIPVFAHPTNLRGLGISVHGGVDVLAHTVPMAGALPDSVISEMYRRHVALIPTLTLWESDSGPDTTGLGAFVATAQAQVREYWERGGRILFGTDVGYIAHYNPTREYELLVETGLDFHAILESLTQAPAHVFGVAHRTGRLTRGYDGDVVVVDGDPATDIRSLARVRLTIKRGRILYDAIAHAPR